MPPLTPAELSLRGRLAAHKLHSRVDSTAHTAPARQAFLSRFDKEVDPAGILDPAERARRAEHAKRSYFLALSMKAQVARRKKAEATAAEKEALAALSQLEAADSETGGETR